METKAGKMPEYLCQCAMAMAQNSWQAAERGLGSGGHKMP